MRLWHRWWACGIGTLMISAGLIGPTCAFDDQPVLEQSSSEKESAGASGAGFASRSTARRQALLEGAGGTEETERSVAAAINWLARHQNPDGSWGCLNFEKQCKDPTCKAHLKSQGVNQVGAEYPMAATAFGLLPLLASGQTHDSKGPYQAVIRRGLLWLTRNQDPKTGRLGTGSMYEHGLGTIALCEAYGLSKDARLRVPAQAAVRFTEDAQNDESGGWHYTANPPTVGDTSVFGWQFMSLKTAQMAGLQVNPQTIVRAKKFLASVSKGKSGGLSSYMPESGPAPAMSAVGLLCKQYSGMKRTDPALEEGKNYLMANLNGTAGDSYFLYYAAQVMHHLPGPERDRWNKHTRELLLSKQVNEGCASGSWAPVGHSAGPVMSTSIHALTLAVYYRYEPLYPNEEPKNDPPKKE